MKCLQPSIHPEKELTLKRRCKMGRETLAVKARFRKADASYPAASPPSASTLRRAKDAFAKAMAAKGGKK